MRPSILLTFTLTSTASARSIKWVFDNVGMFTHFADMTKECFGMMEELLLNNIATPLVPHNDAVDEFRSRPEFPSMPEDDICNLVKYHILRGSYKTDEIAGAGPFLRTMLKQPGADNYEILQVEKESDEDRGRGINFYSGLRRKSTIFYGDYDGGDNIYMHSIDRVLTPPLSMEDTASAAGLTSALGAANKINFDWWRDDVATYFMPNNEAFRKAGSVFKDIPDDELRNILSYHYLNNTETPVYTSRMKTANWTTAGGEDALLSHNDKNDVFVNTAKIVQPNILVQNGVIHVIDQVSNPNNLGSRTGRSSPFSLSAFPNATASDKPPFADMITQKSKYRLEGGQDQAKVPVAHR